MVHKSTVKIMLDAYETEKELWLYKLHDTSDFNKGRLLGRLEMAYIIGGMSSEEYQQERMEILSIGL